MRRRLGRLVRDRRGGVGALVAGALPMLVGCAAIAVDLASVQLETRQLQGIADAAALAAAADPAHAETAAAAVVAQARFAHAVTSEVAAGRYRADPALAPAARFVASGIAGADAARVRLSAPSPSFFARAFGRNEVAIARTATAIRADVAAFSVGSRLVSLDAGLLNAYLSALTGSDVSLSVMDYRALAAADVDLLAFLSALHTQGSVRAASFDGILAAEVSGAQALGGLAAVVPGGDAGAAVARLASAATGGRRIRLGALAAADALVGRDDGPAGLVRVDALSLLTVLLQLASPTRQVQFDLGAGVPGLADTRVTLAVGEREAHSPWIAATAQGTPVLRTAQTRLYAQTRIGGVALPGIAAPVTLDLPLFVEAAGAEARLSGIGCTSVAARHVLLEARTRPARAAIAEVDPRVLEDFTAAVPLSDARLLRVPLLLDLRARSVLDLGAAEPWQRLRFDAGAIASGTRRTVASGTPTRSLAASLAEQVRVDVRLLGLPLPVQPIAGATGQALGAAAPALDGLLNLASGSLGVHYGEADLRVTGMRCGQPVLVG